MNTNADHDYVIIGRTLLANRRSSDPAQRVMGVIGSALFGRPLFVPGLIFILIIALELPRASMFSSAHEWALRSLRRVCIVPLAVSSSVPLSDARTGTPLSFAVA